MGNTGSSTKRDRAYSSDNDCAPSSPGRDDKSFDIGKKNFLYQPSLDENDDFSGTYKDKGDGDVRPRTTTITTGASINETALPTVFKWEGGGKEVYISGSFTEWKPIRMVHSHGDFVLILDVPEGDHQYKFLVDGQWVHDPNEPVVDNDMGTKNNLVTVKKSDFEVFEALAMDSFSTSGGSQCKYDTGIPGSPPGEYSQEVPQRKPYEKTSGPPILPPHLLQVILNKDIPLSCEPTLLPEPNHVMLNHLYALSIKAVHLAQRILPNSNLNYNNGWIPSISSSAKLWYSDGVMVLSATHRYRKKYVTTLLYKPI